MQEIICHRIYDTWVLSMKKIIVILIVLALGWYGNQKYRSYKQEQLSDKSEAAAVNLGLTKSEKLSDKSQFKCDDRTYCSQMTSCEEAKFFIKTVPTQKWTATTMEFLASDSGANSAQDIAYVWHGKP